MKSQSNIGGVLTLTTAVIVVFTLQTVLPGQALKVAPEVDNHEFENKAILLANSLMSDPKLIHLDSSNSYKRGVFEKTKLESVNKQITDTSYIKFYPGTFSHVTIMDMDSTTLQVWNIEMWDGTSENIKKFFECRSNPPIDIQDHDPIEICAPKRSSSIMDDANLDEGASVNLKLGFPIAIKYPSNDEKYPNEVHQGLMFLVVVE